MKNAKEILKDKFWLVIDNGKNVGTISFDNDHYIVNSDGKYEVYKNKSNIKKKLGDLTWTQLKIQETTQYDVHKFVCNSKPYNSMWDLKKKLPLFTKSEKSKSVYCAGYYIIKFNKGSVKSFWPKLITIERYDYKGPFKTKIEMRQQWSIENAKSTN